MAKDAAQLPTDREAAVEQRDRLRHLTRSPEWGMVMAFISTQCEYRVKDLMTSPVTCTVKAAEQNFTRGEYSGMQLVKDFVEKQLGAAENLIELYKEQQKLETGDVS